MNYPYYGNPYMPPMQDNLAQLRQQQMQAIPPMPQNPLPQSGVQWVSGEQEARSWMVAPNAAVALWDSTAPTVYLKQADASGKPTLKVYDLVERLASAPDAQKAPAARNHGLRVFQKVGGHVLRRIGIHGAELQNAKQRFVFSHALLPKQHRPGGICLYPNGQRQQKRA